MINKAHQILRCIDNVELVFYGLSLFSFDDKHFLLTIRCYFTITTASSSSSRSMCCVCIMFMGHFLSLSLSLSLYFSLCVCLFPPHLSHRVCVCVCACVCAYICVCEQHEIAEIRCPLQFWKHNRIVLRK